MKNKSDFFKVNLIYFVILMTFCLVRIVSALGILSFMGSFGNYFLNFIIQIGAMLIIPLVLFSCLKKQKVQKTFNNFAYKKISFKAVLMCIVIGILVFILNVIISTIFNSILNAIGYAPNTSSARTSYPFGLFVVSIIFTAILPAICEEFTHRGMLLYGYKKLGMKWAILLSALFFGLMHMNIEQFFYATIIGILLGFLTVMTGSIFPAMIVHFMNNAISVWISFASFNNLFLGDFYTNLSSIFGQNFFVALLLTFTIVIVCSLLLVAMIYVLFKETRLKNFTKVSTQVAKEELRKQLLNGIEGLSFEKQPEDSIIKVSGNGIVEVTMPMDYFPKKKYKLQFYEKIFLIVNICLGVLITLSTFIWGVL